MVDSACVFNGGCWGKNDDWRWSQLRVYMDLFITRWFGRKAKFEFKWDVICVRCTRSMKMTKSSYRLNHGECVWENERVKCVTWIKWVREWMSDVCERVWVPRMWEREKKRKEKKMMLWGMVCVTWIKWVTKWMSGVYVRVWVSRLRENKRKKK